MRTKRSSRLLRNQKSHRRTPDAYANLSRGMAMKASIHQVILSDKKSRADCTGDWEGCCSVAESFSGLTSGAIFSSLKRYVHQRSASRKASTMASKKVWEFKPYVKSEPTKDSRTWTLPSKYVATSARRQVKETLSGAFFRSSESPRRLALILRAVGHRPPRVFPSLARPPPSHRFVPSKSWPRPSQFLPRTARMPTAGHDAPFSKCTISIKGVVLFERAKEQRAKIRARLESN
eukprot:scaffold803_cov310-Pinguiococcus_pyrenoidosus.AAC.202